MVARALAGHFLGADLKPQTGQCLHCQPKHSVISSLSVTPPFDSCHSLSVWVLIREKRHQATLPEQCVMGTVLSTLTCINAILTITLGSRS